MAFQYSGSHALTGSLTIKGSGTGYMSASGFIYSDSTKYEEHLPIVVWESGSGRYYHTHSLKLEHIVVDNGLNSDGPIVAPKITTGTATTTIGDSIYTRGTSSLAGNITASGNISASGNLYGYDLVTQRDITVGRTLIAVQNISSSGIIYNSMSQDPGDLPTQLVMWDSGSGRFYHSASVKTKRIEVDEIVNKGDFRATGTVVSFDNIPTSDPGVTGRVWNYEGVLRISLG